VSLGRFLFGGAISGQVTIRGSMVSFYCGHLLTGVTEGQFEGAPQAPGNFFVQGDIRNILVKGSMGVEGVASTWLGRTAPTYFTGRGFRHRGKVGQIKAGDDYFATATVHNTNVGNGLRLRQQEIEFRRPTDAAGQFTEFENGQFGDNERSSTTTPSRRRSSSAASTTRRRARTAFTSTACSSGSRRAGQRQRRLLRRRTHGLGRR
jgi:hypothetical protein